MLQGVDEVVFFVKDIEEVKRWIQNLLQCPVVFESPEYCAVLVGNTKIGLHLRDEKNSGTGSGQVAYWHVHDMEHVIKKFQDAGCRLYRGPIRGMDGPMVCQMQDPFGNIWGFVDYSVLNPSCD
ncbi:VOC family protein [Sulfobacillus thermosulfidooxidans]|uniref:VOC family protein n=1 Tax=Sulfobacillus thermosulfidooxidans TaxID=28034 RepID=UPI0006B568A9|nr:glyoxalase/bleomycin resistance/extradiol dioxygenase family protein [Sulfobacillus thermosulfidooxidans]